MSSNMGLQEKGGYIGIAEDKGIQLQVSLVPAYFGYSLYRTSPDPHSTYHQPADHFRDDISIRERWFPNPPSDYKSA